MTLAERCDCIVDYIDAVLEEIEVEDLEVKGLVILARHFDYQLENAQ